MMINSPGDDPIITADTLRPLIRLTLPGTPQQQGSKNVNRYGATYEQNKHLAAWRADAIHVIGQHYAGPTLMGPVSIDATFLYGRPAAHFGTGRNRGTLKPSAPTMKATAPDLDKLQRALGDALTMAGVLADDRLIVHWDSRKCWTIGIPRTELYLWESAP